MILSNYSCNRNNLLIIPKGSIVYTRKDNVLSETLLETYVSKGYKYILIFSDAGCYECEQELVLWSKHLKDHPEINPIFVINYLYPEVYLVRALKDSIFHPTILYRYYELSVHNNLSENIRYLIIDDKLKILSKGKVVNDKKIKKILERKL